MNWFPLITAVIAPSVVDQWVVPIRLGGIGELGGAFAVAVTLGIFAWRYGAMAVVSTLGIRVPDHEPASGWSQ